MSLRDPTRVSDVVAATRNSRRRGYRGGLARCSQGVSLWPSKRFLAVVVTYKWLMDEMGGQEMRWIRAGMVAGVWACLAYPAAIFVPLPLWMSAALAASFGPALALACVGLWRLIRLHQASVAAAAGAGLNAVAGALFTAMRLVQLAIGVATGNHAEQPLQAVWLGLDVACDVYIGVGTALFGFSMLRHPRFGWVFGGSGIAIALALLGFTLYTFPVPPAEAGLVDLGPILGVWYFAVILKTLQSLSWAREAVRNAAT